MKGKYITVQILLACLTKPSSVKKDIYAELQETIAERKKILQQWEKIFNHRPSEKIIRKKGIHEELEETIAEYAKMIQQWKRSLAVKQNNSSISAGKKAA